MHNQIFENECDEIIKSLNTRELVHANSIVNLVTKTYKKHPLLFLPPFIEDYVCGMSGTALIKKYNLLNFSNFYALLTLLNLKTKHNKDSDLDAKDKNLQDPVLRKRYQFLSKYVNLLHGPLENLLNYAILKALLSYTLLNHTYIAGENIQEYVNDAYAATNKEIPILDSKDRITSFEQYLGDNFSVKIRDVIAELHERGYVIAHKGNVSVTSDYPKFAEHVYSFLQDAKNGIRYETLQRRVFKKFPLFRLAISNVQIFENILNGFESRNSLVRKKSFWKYLINNDHLFTPENYADMMQVLDQQRLESGRTKFFGRTIRPELFISELKSLEYGDIGDEDDQVTRIAGLVLSDAARLQNPHETLKEFDFVIDLANYNFRPEQKEIMKKLDFEINSNIFHCKVMIDYKVTTKVLSKLADALPRGEQGVIFTCKPVSKSVSNIIANDKTIQVLNEDAIRDWCTVTPILPCRKNSVARIRYGDNVGKTVIVRSLNYESVLATANTIPDNQEILIPIGSIEEMIPGVSSVDDFETVSNNYLDFLHLLASISEDSFEAGFNTSIVAVHDSWVDLQMNMHPEHFDTDTGFYLGPIENFHTYDLAGKGFRLHNTSDRKHDPTTKDFVKEHNDEHSQKYLEFKHVYSTMIMYNPLNNSKCTCGHLLNVKQHQTLCPHLVAGFNYLCIESGDAKTILENIAKLTTPFSKYRLSNMTRSIETLSYALGSESPSLKSYLDMHINNNP